MRRALELSWGTPYREMALSQGSVLRIALPIYPFVELPTKRVHFRRSMPSVVNPRFADQNIMAYSDTG